ncbi:hypothetical protein ACLMJK_009397 [Lecanora helva]
MSIDQAEIKTQIDPEIMHKQSSSVPTPSERNSTSPARVRTVEGGWFAHFDCSSSDDPTQNHVVRGMIRKSETEGIVGLFIPDLFWRGVSINSRIVGLNDNGERLILDAICCNPDNELSPSGLDLGSYLSNQDGHIRWIDPSLGPGIFRETARNIRLCGPKKNVLKAELMNHNGDWMEDSVCLDEQITTTNGTMEVFLAPRSSPCPLAPNPRMPIAKLQAMNESSILNKDVEDLRMVDLDETIQFLKEIISVNIEHHPKEVYWLYDLARRYRSRYERTLARVDLEESIHFGQRAAFLAFDQY